MELVPSLNNPEMSPKDETVASSINNKILTGILFEFCYSILLQFSLEELSQVENISRHSVSMSSLHHWCSTFKKYSIYNLSFEGSLAVFCGLKYLSPFTDSSAALLSLHHSTVPVLGCQSIALHGT
jgi:hypothetical protein